MCTYILRSIVIWSIFYQKRVLFKSQPKIRVNEIAVSNPRKKKKKICKFKGLGWVVLRYFYFPFYHRINLKFFFFGFGFGNFT